MLCAAPAPLPTRITGTYLRMFVFGMQVAVATQTSPVRWFKTTMLQVARAGGLSPTRTISPKMRGRGRLNCMPQAYRHIPFGVVLLDGQQHVPGLDRISGGYGDGLHDS